MKKSQENDEEQKWDKLLQIHTTGRDDSDSDQYRYPYEPTPYKVLERLTAVARAESIFSFPIRHDVTRLVWNITSGFMRKR